MSVLALRFAGRIGNAMTQYAFARAYAERHGLTLQTEPWIGQEIFNLSDPPILRELPMRDEDTLSADGEGDVCYRSYSQCQKCIIYNRSQVRSWFTVRDHLKAALPSNSLFWPVVCHERRGDYQGYGYVVVSHASYVKALNILGLENAHFCTEENPSIATGIPAHLSFLMDFHLMMNADVLLRGNSCFSWWAATLGHGRVYSPIIDGLEGSKEHDVNFTEGNHPKFANLHGITDLTIPI